MNRVDDYFSTKERENLEARADSVANVVSIFLLLFSSQPVGPDNTVDPQVRQLLARSEGLTQLVADDVAQANVSIRLGSVTQGSDGTTEFVPAPGNPFEAMLTAEARPGQAREPISVSTTHVFGRGTLREVAIDVTLSQPYTYHGSTVATITWLLLIIALTVLGASFVLASILARRLTTPLRRLTEASRGLAEGDLDRRVPADLAMAGGVEIAELSSQFNAMADRVQESVEIIRRDRDRGRDFLADVSHELRTPIAALRTFNELLQERAGDDPVARAEFLESSGQQIERLDWLAQNLLELSKLDSGLLLLDLRPDDLRACVESAVEQAHAAARRRGVGLALSLPDHPVRIRHDPPRIGQVVSNLVGNALKFTPRGGSVTVELRGQPDGAQIVVRDTGIGIDGSELPHIFERFYRGSLANEARGSGSGLGLAIVHSIVDMHHGRIGVESQLGHGSTFTVTLPRDPRDGEGAASEPVVEQAPRPGTGESTVDPHSTIDPDVTNSSPSDPPRMNPGLSR